MRKEWVKMEEIKIVKTTSPKEKPQDESKLGFGQYYTDHMFVMDYDEGQGWHDPRVVPYGPIPMDPAAMCLHYGQEVFEGLKAYRRADGKIQLFRPDKNMARMNISNDRLCIPPIDEEFGIEAIKAVVRVDADWVPSEPGTSLYIRPYIFATEPHVGVHPARHLMFVIILSPVGAYYPNGLDPVKIYVEKEYVRAVKGGTGFAKTAGNYASSLKAQYEADKKGYTQVLWLDGVEKKYIEEVGTMNVFFIIGDEVVTPALNGSILSGITRMSVIEMLKSWGMKVSERRISIQELYEAHDNGTLKEAFGTGTAAVISPIGQFDWDGRVITVADGGIGEISQKLYDTLTGIQSGQLEDTFGWTVEI